MMIKKRRLRPTVTAWLASTFPRAGGQEPTPRLGLIGLLTLVAALSPSLAFAASPGGPLVGFGSSVLDFLTGPLAYVVFGIGIAIAALGMIMGSRDAVQRGVLALVGGGLLFGVHAVIDFVQQAAR